MSAAPKITRISISNNPSLARTARMYDAGINGRIRLRPNYDVATIGGERAMEWLKSNGVVDIREGVIDLDVLRSHKSKYQQLFDCGLILREARGKQSKDGFNPKHYTAANIARALHRIGEESSLESKYGEMHDEAKLAIRALLAGKVATWNRIMGFGKLKIDLTGARLFKISIPGADLRRVILRHVHLDKSDLSNVDLRRAQLEEGCFDNALFRGAKLGGAKLRNSSFIRSDFTGANLKNSDLSHANFHEAEMVNAVLSGANLEETSFSMANLKKADLSGVRGHNAYFNRANLIGADLRNADFYKAELIDARMDLAKTEGMNTSWAVFKYQPGNHDWE